MARHIMAVCVVCLLCADHLPCQQHIDDSIPPPAALSRDGSQHGNIEYQQLNAKVYQRTDLLSTKPPSILSTITTTDKLTTHHTNYNNIHNDNNFDTTNHLNDGDEDEDGTQLRRKRRHAGHAHDVVAQHRPEITENFLQRIFDEYGEDDGTIKIDEFQRMLRQLGLHQLLQQKFKSDELNKSQCINDRKLVQHVQPHDLSHHHKHSDDKETQHSGVKCTFGGSNNTQCSHAHTANEINGIHNGGSTSTAATTGGGSGIYAQTLERQRSDNYTLSENDVFNLCPVLLYQLASPLEFKRNGCIDSAVLAAIDKYETKQYNGGNDDIVHVWIYAFISVFACGILGLVGVAIIPFMDSRYYKHILQFLVSLAVGTMTGDALLHLLPHSLAGQTESNMIFKGLTCMSGIIFFYITEHGLTMIAEWRRRTQKEGNTKPSRAKVVRDPDSSINNSTAGDKLCKSKYSSYPYCYDEIAMDTKNDMHLPAAKQHLHSPKHVDHKHNNGKSDAEASELAAAQQSLLSTSHNNYAPMTDMNHHQQQQQQQHNNHVHSHHQLPTDNNTISTDLDGNSIGDELGIVNGNSTAVGRDKTMDNDTVTVILREHEASHHGHSHTHGHVHSPPETLSAVAWMIIMGDGLHNFTDGMAIGAAFAENIAGGFSTSLAVFCHELPHELGDFAILMKAGMSVKSAVYYNLLTGVLSFIGMIFGIVFGQSQEAAQWMFAAAAGLFIYIALVDMMPELSAAHKTLAQFALQILGMCSGVFIMLLIAIYEGDLMNVFSSNDAGQHVH